MGLVKLLTFLTVIGTPVLVAYLLYGIVSDHPVPVIKDEFWGPGSKPGVIPAGKEDETIRPFKVDFTSPAVLQDLKTKLKSELDSGRLTPPLEGIGFQYGFNTNYLKKVITYWREKYDFAAREKYLNRFPHFKTKIGGLDIHFQHAKPTDIQKKKYKKTVPVIFIHGWPGSFVEHQKLIELLHEPKDSEINFEVIIPSLPGYGYSQGSSRPGMSGLRIANLLGRLMKRLGYDKYYALGEDWGTFIATDMGILYPENVKGAHFACYTLHPRDLLVQSLVAAVSPSTIFPTKRLQERWVPTSKILSFSLRESGYLHIQATKPDTVGVGVSLSPTGLAAYIIEKFSTWTTPALIDKEDGGLSTKFTMDSLLDNIMVYWTSKSITTSMRLYSETFHDWGTFRVPLTVPAACIAGTEDVIGASEIGLKAKYPNLKQFTATDDGGHFQAYEMPQVVAKSALKFFNDVELGRVSVSQ